MTLGSLKTGFESAVAPCKDWLRGRDLNPGPQGYEPCELPDCSTPRQPIEVLFIPCTLSRVKVGKGNVITVP